MRGERVFVVVTAAGMSRRMGGVDKLTLPLLGMPLLARTVSTFLNWKKTSALIVSVTPGREEEFRALLAPYRQAGSPEIAVVGGGKERQDSIRIALELLAGSQDPTEDDIVLIHDGARPFVDSALFEALLRALHDADGVIPATPVRDTIKRVHGPRVLGTEDRETLRMVQTPQAFRLQKILGCHREARQLGFLGTDDASLVEHFGGTVSWIDGPVDNLKVTVPEDMPLLEELAKNRLAKAEPPR